MCTSLSLPEARPYSELPRAAPQASFPSERTTGHHPNPNPKTNPIPLTLNAQASFPFEDHGVPPLEMLDALARSVQACAHTVHRLLSPNDKPYRS